MFSMFLQLPKLNDYKKSCSKDLKILYAFKEDIMRSFAVITIVLFVWLSAALADDIQTEKQQSIYQETIQGEINISQIKMNLVQNSKSDILCKQAALYDLKAGYLIVFKDYLVLEMIENGVEPKRHIIRKFINERFHDSLKDPEILIATCN
jgi:hypothetical protein